FLSYGSRYTSTCSGEKENFSYNVFNVPLVVLSSFNNNRSSTCPSCSIKKSIIAACLWACEYKSFFVSCSSFKECGITYVLYFFFAWFLTIYCISKSIDSKCFFSKLICFLL